MDWLTCCTAALTLYPMNCSQVHMPLPRCLQVKVRLTRFTYVSVVTDTHRTSHSPQYAANVGADSTAEHATHHPTHRNPDFGTHNLSYPTSFACANAFW